MAFSFNPGQVGQSESVGIAPSAPVNVNGATQEASLPSVPDSPFLFLQQRGRDKSIMAYLQLILALVAILTIVYSIMLAAYSFYLQSSIKSKQDDLANSELTFKDYPLEEMKPLSDRIAALSALLQGYVSIRSPLKLLEDVVERQVVFSQFTITHQKSGGYIANFTAVTSDYQSLIQQLEALQLTQYNKVAPSSKYDNFKEDKNQVLKVEITTPVFVQGVLPDDIVFVQSASSTQAAPSESQATTTAVITGSSTTQQ